MVAIAEPLIAELDTTLGLAPNAWRITTLRRLTDLFLAGAASYTAEQVAVFDDVIGRLIDKLERRSLIELSNRLAQVDNAPVNVIGTLARSADLLIAGPILKTSPVLTDKDLIEIADRDRKDHALLLTILERPQLGEAVTEILVKRGNSAVARKIIDHPGARISELSFATLVSGIERDKELASAIGKREDLPPELRPWIAAALAQ
jgi:uncharacterized protein (DUF2336 family)